MQIEKEPLLRLLHWIKERESIRLKRLDGLPKPWTGDPILQRFRFCNVRRMDDKVSQWLLQNWYLPNYNHPNMLAACCLARFFNLPDTLEAIGFPTMWDPVQIKSIVRALKQEQTIFNSAYMVRGNDGEDKASCVVDYTIQSLVDNPPLFNPKSMQLSWEVLKQRYGFGSFMAGQIIADLRWAMEGTWVDRGCWAPAGPGSMRGLNRLLGTPLKQTWKQDEFLAKLSELVKKLRAQLPSTISQRLEFIDWQNCLCEYDKYDRVLLGQGRPKQLYQGI